MPDEPQNPRATPTPEPSEVSWSDADLSDVPRPPAGHRADRTWAPAAGDAFDELDDPNTTPDQPPPDRNQTPPPPQNTPDGPAIDTARAALDTYAPAGSEIEDLWGDQFDSGSPRHTLKGPGQGISKSAARAQLEGFVPDVPANVRVEGYDLLKILGEGGVGVVYEARQKSIDRTIAVKMIKSGLGSDAGERKKFLTEAMVTGKLDHPNIVPIHDLGQTDDGQPFYAMKMVHGTPWEQVLDQKTQTENLRIFLDVCDAVAFAHARGVVHRDLKPENVMLGEYGEVQLMDWGLGLLVDDNGCATNINPTLAAGGTPAYMAPEMVTGDDGPVGVHSDIYLLGGILYEIITGKPPHGGRLIMECLENARENIIQPTEQTGVLLDIALKAMASLPADRYTSVNALKDALLDYQAHAESINLCQRCFDDLRTARQAGDYELFTQALFGFREARQLWKDNEQAATGETETQFEYAHCAYQKGDLDLAASLLDDNCPGHRQLAAEIADARQRRETAKRRLRVLRWSAIGLTAGIVVILAVAATWISWEKARTEQAKDAAVAAQQSEAEQRRLAEAAMLAAQREERKAKAARDEMEKAIKAMLQAQSEEERARAEATASELAATEARDELAKTGMLLDNSWWVFDADTARQRVAETADELALPADLRVDLDGDAGLDLRLIPAGQFAMGSPAEEEHRAAEEYLHRVVLTRPFYLAATELTWHQWAALSGEPLDATVDPNQPVTGLSYDDVLARLLPAVQPHAPQGHRFRLPTEAEWEYACRAGTPTPYYSGAAEDDLAAVGWYLMNSDRALQPVAGKQPNAFGLYDMLGNVGEMCIDHHDAKYYLNADREDPHAALDGENPIVRGGSVFNTAEHCRAAYRSYIYRQNRYEFVGVRLALVPADWQPDLLEVEPRATTTQPAATQPSRALQP